jgi:hypothetical protein
MAIPKLALIPATQGSKLYSVLPSDGVGDFTFSRGTTATRINKDGLIETVASGVSRLNYPLINGVVNGCPSHLLEPERSNLQIRSEEFNDSVWTKTRSSITPNDAISPSGLLNADKLVGVSGANSYVFDGISVTSGSVYQISVFAKYIDISEFRINVFGQSGDAIFNISNGTVTSSTGTVTEPKIENYGSGWYRVSAKFTATATGNVNYGFYLNNAIGKSVHIWGAQFELGDFASSYIPTTTAIVTRSAETANGSGSSTVINSTEGVLYVETKGFTDLLTSSNYIQLSKNGESSGTNSLMIQHRSNGYLRVYVNAFASADIHFNINIDFTENHKIAVLYKLNGYKLFIDGVAQSLYGTPTQAVFSGLDNLSFDFRGASSWNGSIKQLQYFDSALTDAELTTLTTI